MHANINKELTAGICVLLAMVLFIAISFRSVFLADVARLYRHGLLLSACFKVMTHRFILWFYVIAAAFYISSLVHLGRALQRWDFYLFFYSSSLPVFTSGIAL